jgi:hypothetical protein
MKTVVTIVAIVCVVVPLAMLGYFLLILWRFGKL